MWSLKLNHINFKAQTCELQRTNYLCTEQTTQASTSEQLSLRLLCHCPVIKIYFQCCNTVWQLHTPAMMKGTKILCRIVWSTTCATALGKPTVACLPTLHNCLSAPICAIIIRSNWIPSCDAPRTRCPVVLHKLRNCKYASWSDTQPWSLQICDICPQNLSVFRRILSHSYWCICIFPPSQIPRRSCWNSEIYPGFNRGHNERWHRDIGNNGRGSRSRTTPMGICEISDGISGICDMIRIPVSASLRGSRAK